MSRTLPSIFVVLAALGLVLYSSVFTVAMTQQALVMQFGQIRRIVTEPGLHFKTPFVESVIRYDDRNIGLTLDNTEILGSDQERLIVDAFVRYRITKPDDFYRSVQNEFNGNARLSAIFQSSTRRILGSVTTEDIVSNRRAELMRQIAAEMNRGKEGAQGMGVTVVDVRLTQTDLVEQVRKNVFARMKSERKQVAAEIRAKGDEEATKIRAEADRQKTMIIAEAEEKAQKIKGQGEGQRAAIYSASYGKNAEFAAFYRSMQAYEKAIPAGTQMIVPPDGEFFRYLRNQSGGR